MEVVNKTFSGQTRLAVLWRNFPRKMANHQLWHFGNSFSTVAPTRLLTGSEYAVLACLRRCVWNSVESSSLSRSIISAISHLLARAIILSEQEISFN